MKIALQAVVIGVFAVTGAVFPAPAEATDAHTIVPPQKMEWAPGPTSLPPGAEAMVLYGDPSKEGLFALRLKLPGGYQIAPHTHPEAEVVTVMSGTFRLGLGEVADQNAASPLSAGSFFALPPGLAHYVFIEEESVIQINSVGPWGIDYIDPANDPRKQ